MVWFHQRPLHFIEYVNLVSDGSLRFTELHQHLLQLLPRSKMESNANFPLQSSYIYISFTDITGLVLKHR
jgi:hypothetical protein